jgi:hypothetical protein
LQRPILLTFWENMNFTKEDHADLSAELVQMVCYLLPLRRHKAFAILAVSGSWDEGGSKHKQRSDNNLEIALSTDQFTGMIRQCPPETSANHPDDIVTMSPTMDRCARRSRTMMQQLVGRIDLDGPEYLSMY